MPQQTLENRLEILEQKVESLEGLPNRVAALEPQIVQFREEMRLEFSAVRREMRAGTNSLAETLRGEIRGGEEETRRQMRVLHEDVISRIALLNEGLNGRKRSREGRR